MVSEIFYAIISSGIKTFLMWSLSQVIFLPTADKRKVIDQNQAIFLFYDDFPRI